jgi:hypothetical protein
MYLNTYMNVRCTNQNSCLKHTELSLNFISVLWTVHSYTNICMYVSTYVNVYIHACMCVLGGTSKRSADWQVIHLMLEKSLFQFLSTFTHVSAPLTLILACLQFLHLHATISNTG